MLKRGSLSPSSPSSSVSPEVSDRGKGREEGKGTTYSISVALSMFEARFLTFDSMYPTLLRHPLIRKRSREKEREFKRERVQERSRESSRERDQERESSRERPSVLVFRGLRGTTDLNVKRKGREKVVGFKELSPIDASLKDIGDDLLSTREFIADDLESGGKDVVTRIEGRRDGSVNDHHGLALVDGVIAELLVDLDCESVPADEGKIVEELEKKV